METELGYGGEGGVGDGEVTGYGGRGGGVGDGEVTWVWRKRRSWGWRRKMGME